MLELTPLSKITSVHSVRPINERHVKRLSDKIQSIGLLRQYPLAVTPDGVLYGGLHRYEALKRLGFTDAYMDVGPPPNGSLTKAALDLNVASEDALPMTFCDHAELIWRLLDDGKTQQVVSEEIGWSRQQVSQYAMLKGIDGRAWDIVATTFRNNDVLQEQDGVATVATGVANFTEGLLRDITRLTASQQLDLVQRLARGKDAKGHRFDKSDFKAEAQRFNAYNDLCIAVREALASRMPEERAASDIDTAILELNQKSYIDEWLNGGGKTGKRFDNLIQAYVSAYEDELNSRVIVKDMREISSEDVQDNSIDAIVTDPPYPLEFVDLFNDLGLLASRVLKPGGSLVVLCGQSYLTRYLDLLSRHLDYLWTIGVHMPGGQAVQLYQREVTAFWKPALWFTKGQRDGKWVSDFIRTDTNNNDKRFHKWGQSEQIMSGLIERVSLSGETVLDPFLGGGTSGVVCRSLKRKFIGVEIDENLAKQAQKRIAEAL